MVLRNIIFTASLAGVLALTAAIEVPGLAGTANGSTPFVMSNMRDRPDLSVMTYNIEGLPWPVRFGRDASFEKIGTRLRDLREAGEQPHIVALQEAFSSSAKQVGIEGGYRYVVDGPAANLSGAPAVQPADIAFQSAARFIDGERSGKLVDSGLQILSDYPILSVRRMAFPQYACAGYDCLANKGAVLAMIAVPGIARPIAVVDVHLNSRTASGTDDKRSLYAYQRQIDALDSFLASAIEPGTPVIVAGDFNVGNRPARRAYFEAHFRHWGGGPAAGLVQDALGTCLRAAAPCGANLPGDAVFSRRRGKDWQIAVPGSDYALGVDGLSVPFGHQLDGMMLSDHVGYTAYYRVVTHRPMPSVAMADLRRTQHARA